MPDPKSTAWQIPYFVGDDWQTAIQEISNIREFVREELYNDKKHQAQFGDFLDLFNSVPTPHEKQDRHHPASARTNIALESHQKGVRRLMSSKERWNLWPAWKEQVWKTYNERYAVHDVLHNEWTRVCMNGHTFSNACDFAEFSFPNETSFDHATFSSTANFGGAFFQQISFDNVTFSNIATFADAKFAQSTTFDGVTFSEDTEFYGTIFERPPSFANVTFSKDFRFGRSPFVRWTSIRQKDSDGIPFLLEADFAGATFSRKVCFDGQKFLGKAKFSDATFAGGASFLGTEFHDAANFSGATFRCKTDFWRSIFENAAFTSETSFIYAEFHQPPVFHGAKLHPSTAFSPSLDIWDQFENLNREGARDCFRTLKNHYKVIEAHFEANLFYALEMRATMREEWKERKWRRAALIWVYDKCTAFGLSVFRPLACWLVVQLLLTITLVWFSPANSTPLHSVIDSLSLAFSNNLALPGLVDSNLFSSQIASVFQIGKMSAYDTMYEFNHRFPGAALALGVAKVFSIAFIFLTLLALRNRFRIK